jgi:hypothetical protein
MNTPTYARDGQATSPRDTDRIERWNAPATPVMRDDSSRRPGVDARKLWAGGAASAVVTGLLALVGVLAGRWLLHVPLLAPSHDGAYGDARTTALIIAAMMATLAATGLVHLLLLGTVRPLMFFGWIVALGTAIIVIFPFSTTAPLDAKIASAVVNLALGVAVGTLVGGVATRSVTRRRPAASDPFPPSYDRAGRY